MRSLQDEQQRLLAKTADLIADQQLFEAGVRLVFYGDYEAFLDRRVVAPWLGREVAAGREGAAGLMNGAIFAIVMGIVGIVWFGERPWKLRLASAAVVAAGRAIGSEAFERGQQTIVVARDGRLSGPELTDALIRGLVATGRDVKDIGQVPTPVLYFAAQYLDASSGVMVTGSHNPP